VEERIRKRVEEAAGVMTLYQLREARNLTQVSLAKVLNVNQGAVSRMEKRTDMYVSTLRNFIRAMGGQLQVKAVFPEGEVQIEQFESLAEPQEESLELMHP
jgi:transcriptional regulator with XRE-family HTH domain